MVLCNLLLLVVQRETCLEYLVKVCDLEWRLVDPSVLDPEV